MTEHRPHSRFRRSLPLNALRTFEAAGRKLSFTAAGEELGVSQVAVSRQVRALEDWLGTPLFTRATRSVRLTSAGTRLLPAVSGALDSLALATSQLSRRGQGEVLSIQAYTTFAQRWLIPLLTRFHEQHPDVEVRLTTSTSPVDFVHQDVDAAVRSGDGEHWPGLSADFLAPITLLPVANPTLVGHDVLPLTELGRFTLLHSLARPEDWSRWATAAGVPELVAASRGLRFESSALAYEAALQGSGLAIGMDVLVAPLLAAGALVAPFAARCRLPGGYYLVRPADRAPSRAFLQFRAWLLRNIPDRCGT